MNFYRCLICGDPYMGKEKPSNCPFCGAKDTYLVPAAEWVDENIALGQLSEVSRRNLEKALQLEVNNAPFYRDAMQRTKDIELQGILKYLSKIENEHATVIKKILNCELPQPEIRKEVATDSDMENLKAAHEREKTATAFYRQAADEAIEPRVRRVFTALSEIESDHIHLEGDLLEKK
ncbi:MAG: ferritin-like domain-containing protein [Nitrospirae bacterium]|nr:ferritin-like domain-containing protein [Nitrospirota bacterium]